jgi:hypothetical protein
MGMVALRRGIGSAFVVTWGQYGDVSQFAAAQGVSRQLVYREAKQVAVTLEGTQARQKIERLEAEVSQLRHEARQLQEQLAQAVVLDEEKQAEFACVGQACGVTLPQCHTLLEVLIPGQALSRASLGRRTQAMGEKAGALLEVLDEYVRPLVQDGAADEIYVSAPVLMVVEQHSLCWVCGRLSEQVSGEAWKEEFARLPNLGQMASDGGLALAKGMALVNAERAEQGQEPAVHQNDHFHALWKGGPGLRKAEKRASKALAEAEVAQKALEECARRGQKQTGAAIRANRVWRKAEKAMDTWQQLERLWQQTKDALLPVTPEGELNTREKATAVLAQTLPELPDSEFAKCKRALQQSQMLNYLDRVQDRLAKLPFSQEVVQAAVQQECLRRRAELLQGESRRAAVLRGVMLICAVVLGKAERIGQEALAAVRDILGRAYRTSSLVECINSVLRMHQAQHRKMTQGLLNLKRLYWNCHTFRTGRRRGHTPYQLLGVPWPDGLRWWELLKLTPEQLRQKLSTVKMAA